MNSKTQDKKQLSPNTAQLLLQLLSEKEMYGYEIIETLRRRSQNIFELKAGTLYPLLHEIEEKGYLKSVYRESGEKQRKYYRITASGKKHLNKKNNEWKKHTSAVIHVPGGAAYDNF